MPDKDENKELRARSGEINVRSKLASFLYDLIRDHLPAGTVEQLVREAQVSDVQYTNGWLAKYAEDLALRLEDKMDDLGEDMAAWEEQREKEEKERKERCLRRRLEERHMTQYDRD